MKKELISILLVITIVVSFITWRGPWMSPSLGLYVYRRSAARKVFGTDDPDEIQKYFSDWDKFADSAEKLLDEGWKILAGYDDAYRVYAQNVSDPWVVKGGLRVDDSLMDWVEHTKEFTDRGYNNNDYQWSVEWFNGMTSSGDVFGYFGPEWFIDYSVATWPFCNNWRVMNRLAREGEPNEFLGGQNALPLYCACAEDIRIEHGTAYDWDVEQCFRDAMYDYFEDRVSLDDAMDHFYDEVGRKYPEVVRKMKQKNINKH